MKGVKPEDVYWNIRNVTLKFYFIFFLFFYKNAFFPYGYHRSYSYQGGKRDPANEGPTWSRHSLKRFANNPTLRWCYAHMETRLSPIGMTIIVNFDFWCDFCCCTCLEFNYLRIVLFWKMSRKMFALSQ